MTLEHLYAYSQYSGLPISFQRKTTETYKQRAAQKNEACHIRSAIITENEDDIGLKGVKLYMQLIVLIKL